MFNNGHYLSAKQVPSPNFNRRPNAELSLLVIHNISLPPEQFGGGYIEQFFLNQLDRSRHAYFEEIADMQVSAHFLIDRAGQVTQFVNVGQRAWHAGQSEFEGRSNCNDYSVGVELEGSDTQEYTSEQYHALAELTISIMRAYPSITLDRIVGHSDIAPGRKTDPGPHFNWDRYKADVKAKIRP